MAQPEQQAREEIDRLLTQAGWRVADLAEANIHAARGVALREFPLDSGFGFADYLLYIDGKAVGIIEAKKAGSTLTGVESQSSRYARGLPAALSAWRRPLPFLYESTGVETHFTNGLDPEPRARPVFAFHRPEMLAEWLTYAGSGSEPQGVAEPPSTFLTRVKSMPPPIETGPGWQLWPAQITAVQNLEKSLAEQSRIVAEVDRLLSIAREAEAEVDANLKRAQGLRQAVLRTAFSMHANKSVSEVTQ